MQNELDAARARINIPREKIRQQFLDEERRRQEELAAAEAALKAEQVGTGANPNATTAAKLRTKSRKWKVFMLIIMQQPGPKCNNQGQN